MRIGPAKLVRYVVSATVRTFSGIEGVRCAPDCREQRCAPRRIIHRNLYSPTKRSNTGRWSEVDRKFRFGLVDSITWRWARRLRQRALPLPQTPRRVVSQPKSTGSW